MKNMKKLFAILVAALMIVASMSALAAAGDLNTDTSISISGLDKDDNVKLYKVFQWTDGVGWELVAPFNTAEIQAKTDIAKILNNEATELSADTVAALASAASGDAKYQGDVTGDSFTQANPEAGMYLALVAPAKAGVVYNPIVISADFTAANGTNTIPASSAINGTSIAKKKDVTVEKTEPKITNDVGDTYSYTVKTTIPVYSSTFTNTYFTITDTLSNHLDLDASTIEVVDKNGDAIDVTSYLTSSAHGFTITFPHAYVSALTAAQDITITYDAKLNVPVSELTNVKEEKNTITVEFPNNPQKKTDKTVLKDETREYTFTIDGSLFGNSSYRTSELVKVGLDKDNNPIEEVIEVSNGSSHAALAGATFALYASESAANDAKTNKATVANPGNGLYTNDVFTTGLVTTDEQGEMKIAGLDVGTYYLLELDAPDGYIKDQQIHTINISATITPETIEEDIEGYTVTYDVPVLQSYKITVDGNESSYSMTLDGPNLSSFVPGDSSTELVNTKGVELPSTGGMGTTLFYIGGAVLVLGAVVVMITRRRVRG